MTPLCFEYAFALSTWRISLPSSQKDRARVSFSHCLQPKVKNLQEMCSPQVQMLLLMILCVVRKQMYLDDIYRYVQALQSCMTLWLYGLYPTRLLCPWASLGKNTGVLATPFSRGSSWPRVPPTSPTLQVDSLPLSQWGSPDIDMDMDMDIEHGAGTE